MQVIQNEVASHTTIVMDDKHFVGCKYTDCKLVFSGGEVQWTDSAFNRCQIVLSGAAQRTAALLVNMGAIPRGGILQQGQVPQSPKPDGKVN